MGKDCATGVVFTRNPSTGKNEIYGEYLINAQGEDVVAGTRTPQYITKKARIEARTQEKSMEESMPTVFKKLYKILKNLEKHYKDMQDVEFTVERINFGYYKQDLEKGQLNLQLKLQLRWLKKS